MVTRCATASSLGANGPGRKCGLARPRCTDSQAAQSCRFVMSQNSTAPAASGADAVGVGHHQPGALDPGAARRERQHPVGHHVVGVRRDQQVRQQVRGTPRASGSTPGSGVAASSPVSDIVGHPVAQVHRAADPGAGQVVVVARVRRAHLAELRVDQRAVVALVVVLGDHLPVRGDLVGVPVGEHQRARRRTARPAGPSSPRCSANDGTSALPSGCSACPNTQPCQTATGSSTRPCSVGVERRRPRGSRGARPATRRGRRSTRGRGTGCCAAADVSPSGSSSWPRCRQVFANIRSARRRRAPAAPSTSPTGTARWVDRRPPVGGGSRSSTRPRQVQLPANRCRCSQASTSAEVYAVGGQHLLGRAVGRGRRRRTASSGSACVSVIGAPPAGWLLGCGSWVDRR